MKESEIRLTSRELQKELPTLIQAFIAFAESLESLDLVSVQAVITDPTSKVVMLAADQFKRNMKPVLERRHGLH